MKRITSLFLAALMLVSLCSCSVKGSGKSFSYLIAKSPSTLDPQFAGETEAQIIINNVFEGLVRFDGEGKIIPGVAEKWDVSSDGLTYTFYLKENCEWFCPSSLKKELDAELYEYFANATITAHDFVFAFRRAVMPETGSSMAYKLLIIENAAQVHSGEYAETLLGVTAINDLTLQIKLNEPCEDLLERLTESVFMPCNERFFEAMGGRYGLQAKYLLCNGPFYVSTWDSENYLTIRNNKYYSGENDVMPLTVTFNFNPDKNELAEKVGAGSVSAGLLPPGCAVPENVNIIKETANTTFGFLFNCADSALANENIRKALCAGINPSVFDNEINGAVAQTGLVPASCFVGSYNYRSAVGEQVMQPAYNPVSANDLWHKGVEELAESTVSLTVLCPKWIETQVRRQVQIWQKDIGISLAITVQAAEDAEIEAALEAGNYQIVLADIRTDYLSAVDFLAQFRNSNIFNYSSQIYNAQTDAMLVNESDEKMLEACFAAESMLLSSGVCYPLYSRSSCFVVMEEADGITILDSESSVSFIDAKRYD